MIKQEIYEEALGHVSTNSRPSELKITDMRFANLAGAPYPCEMLKIYTNQGLVGFGEVRDMASKTYALMLKGRILGENPCNVDKIFRRIKQFGFHGRQGGGVSGIEIALWDLAGKAYGVPIYQMLGGKFRDKMRIYCDTDADMTEDRTAGEAMGLALKKRLEKGYTLLKMDLGANLLLGKEDMLNYPLGYMEEKASYAEKANALYPPSWGDKYEDARKEVRKITDRNELAERLSARNNAYCDNITLHPFTGVQITERGLDYLENYVADVRKIIGMKVPLALDHFGHIGVEEIIKLARRLEKYSIAWMEDPIAWCYTNQWKRLAESTTIPICTGEDIYLADSFIPLMETGGVGIVHPDALTCGGILETKKLGDLSQKYGVRMVLHQAATPIHAMAAAHIGVATENCWACEFHANDVPWWDDIIISKMRKPLIQNGFIEVPDLPGLGIDDLNDEVIAAHISQLHPGMWEPTNEWDHEYSVDAIYN
ncbi:MAG: mandelate racemase/muconate lactonizing enzyme family protein [Clostridiales bacterium]|jgi:L-alanine-DL-glutamate epimerase-like enolase superfamily enzyme|nr:mandelate racemase/muconate lactonizing enzyme family protein [Clostridiales bacterium]